MRNQPRVLIVEDEPAIVELVSYSLRETGWEIRTASNVASAWDAIVKAKPELRIKLWDNVATLYDGLKARGFVLGPQHGPVVGVHLPDRTTAIGFWRAMLDAGIYVNVAVPPATPNGVSLLRCSLCAAHTREQLEHMIEVMTGIGRQMGVLAPKLRVVAGNH